MALSGSFSGSICEGRYIARVDWTATQSVADNTSTITANLYLVNDAELYISSNRTHYVYIDGEEFAIPAPERIDTTGEHHIGTCTKVVSHIADGTRAVSMSLFFDFRATIDGEYIASIEGGGSFTLDTIARASVPTLSASEVYFDEGINIVTNRASDSFTHDLYYMLNGSDEETLIIKGITTNYRWSVPSSLESSIPDSDIAVITFKLYTFNGSTLIGSKIVSFKAKVRETSKPVINAIACSDPTGYADTYGAFVQKLSTLQVDVDISTRGMTSPVKSYKITANGQNYSENGCVTDALITSGTNNITVTVTDARGRSATSTRTINVLAYTSPTINSLKAFRCDSSGTANEEGQYIKVELKSTITALNNNNDKTFKLEYKKSSDTTWTTHTTYTSAYTWETNVKFAADGNNAYSIRLTAEDAFNTATYEVNVATAFTLMDFNESGKGIAFGKVSEKDAFECALPAEFASIQTTSGADVDEINEAVNASSKYVLIGSIDYSETLNIANIPDGTLLHIEFATNITAATLARFTWDVVKSSTAYRYLNGYYHSTNYYGSVGMQVGNFVKLDSSWTRFTEKGAVKGNNGTIYVYVNKLKDS